MNWQANGRSVSQEIPRLLYNMALHMNPALDTNMSYVVLSKDSF
jgi:hypothetical protein